MISGKKGIRFSFNAPATLGFVAACVLVQILNMITGGASNRTLFSVYRSSLLDPLTYVRLFGHVLGHADWSHLMNNMMYILILGPMLEEKYGAPNMLIVMAATAFATGIMNILLFPAVRLMGASGIVFAMILLASITTKDDHTIPVSFVLVAVLYIGQQICNGIASADNISQMSHIIGGIVGSVSGFAMNRLKMNRYQR